MCSSDLMFRWYSLINEDLLCGRTCIIKIMAPAGGQLWCFVPLVSPRTRVLFRLSTTERTTHTWEDLWNPPQLSTGSATLFREPQVVRVFTIWSIRISMLLKMRGYNLGGAYRFAAWAFTACGRRSNRMSVFSRSRARNFWARKGVSAELPTWISLRWVAPYSML